MTELIGAYPPVVDQFGNITLPGRSAGPFIARWAQDGIPINVSGNVLYFEVSGLLRVPMGPAPIASTFVAYSSGVTMTVLSVTSGLVPTGPTVNLNGPGSGYIASQFSGPPGGPGVYILSVPQTITQQALTCTDVSVRALNLDAAQVAVLPLITGPETWNTVAYMIRDETNPSSPSVAMYGNIGVVGFTAQPPNGPA